MAINIEIEQLLANAKNQCVNLENELNTSLQHVFSDFEQIKQCVRSSGVHASINNVISSATISKNKLIGILPETTNFLNRQMLVYEQNNEITRFVIDKLVHQINDATMALRSLNME